ncbi:TPA: isopeptide-forming domain-containing fimbrial protein [Streptococcus suis]|nr:isopeptide-forming domain-containing fimbrial protein [Streptococcus suis]
MKKITKLFSVFATLLTVFGTLVNLVPVAHATMAISTEHSTKVIVHKIVMNKTDFNAFKYTEDFTQYNGNEISDTKYPTYFGASATEVAGVNFKVWKKVDAKIEGQTKTGTELGITGEGEAEHYQKMTESGYGTNGVNTRADNAGAEFTLGEGTYIFVEDKVASPYYNKQDGDTKGSELTEAKAVPFRLVLPVTLPDGTGHFDEAHPLHVYPKNTEDKPDVKKEFADAQPSPRNVEIGEKIPYKITTEIPKGSSYKTIVWEDLMVEGLDFVEGSIEINSESVTLSKENHFDIEQDKRGFVLKAKTAGLEAIEAAAKNQSITITITYNGVLNDSAIVDTTIPNKVRFHYGNRPRTFQDENPKPVTPDPGENKIIVQKTWGDTAATHPAVEFDIYEEETGVKVGTVTLPENAQSVEYRDNLKQNVRYLVIERPVAGYIPTYTTGAAGTILVNNKPSDNPPPIVPEQPKVITYGKRFIKTDDKEADAIDIEKLTGAEFVVKNAEGKYLALKTSDTKEQEVQKYTEAEQAYLTALKTGNGETEKVARDAAYEALNMQWEWVAEAEQAKAFTFISSKDGKFEVKGLKAGRYELVETKAPEGYALPSSTIPFEVGANTWKDATPQKSIEEHTQIRNKKVTIPQTGGIGTLVFTVVGLSTMVFAFIAMKKRQSEEA